MVTKEEITTAIEAVNALVEARRNFLSKLGQEAASSLAECRSRIQDYLNEEIMPKYQALFEQGEVTDVAFKANTRYATWYHFKKFEDEHFDGGDYVEWRICSSILPNQPLRDIELVSLWSALKQPLFDALKEKAGKVLYFMDEKEKELADHLMIAANFEL